MTRPPSRAAARLLALLEVPALAAVPLVLGVCAYFQVEQGALLTVVVAFAAVGVFFASFEASRPALRQIMPTVVLAALAAAGRMLFAPVPDFKPVSAICILAGAVFGRRSGFLVLYAYGFLSALLYGLLLNGWYVIGFVQPFSWPAALVAFGAALPFDATHGVATVVFLAALYVPWRKKLERIKRKYALI